MENQYLQILELQPGASEKEVKAAYRRLSKKYHPDINKNADAHEQFVRISEAYRFLTQVGPQPNNEPTAYAYDSEAAEYDRWRQQARAWAKRKAREEARLQEELIRKILWSFNFAAVLIVGFNLLLTLDYLLPWQEHPQKILEIHKVVEFSGRYGEGAGYQYDEVRFQNFSMRLNKGELTETVEYEQAIVRATPIFAKPMAALITIDGLPRTYYQFFNIYRIFGYIIPAIFMVIFLYLFIMRILDHKLTLAIFMVVLFLIQVYLFFQH